MFFIADFRVFLELDILNYIKKKNLPIIIFSIRRFNVVFKFTTLSCTGGRVGGKIYEWGPSTPNHRFLLLNFKMIVHISIKILLQTNILITIINE